MTTVMAVLFFVSCAFAFCAWRLDFVLRMQQLLSSVGEWLRCLWCRHGEAKWKKDRSLLRLKRVIQRPILWSIRGAKNDFQLLKQVRDGKFSDEREQCLKSAWNQKFDSVDAYLESVRPNREYLKACLGRFDENEFGKVISEEKVTLSHRSSDNDVLVSKLEIQSRIPFLTFPAYFLRSINRSPLDQIGVVALHGHGSSAESISGLEAEDYGRRFALRLARKGFLVLVPSVTSNTLYANAVSAHAAMHGYSLFGIMTQFVSSCIDVLKQHFATERFAVHGISNGALISLLAGALDSRIDACVPACFLSPYYDHELLKRGPGIHREYLYHFFKPLWEKFDIAHLAMLCVPDILIFSMGAYDGAAMGWQTEFEKVREVYERLRLLDRLEALPFLGGHEIPEDYEISALAEKIGKLKTSQMT